MTERLTLADVVGVYGIKGWVKLRLYLEQPDMLTTLNNIELVPAADGRREPAKAIKVDAVRQQGKGFVAHLAGVDDRTAAEALRGYRLQVASADFPSAGEDEFYWRDLEGLRVWCQEGDSVALLGVVDHLLDTGANDVLVIKPTEGSVDDKERLVPWLPEQNVARVDLAAGELWIDWFVDA